MWKFENKLLFPEVLYIPIEDLLVGTHSDKISPSYVMDSFFLRMWSQELKSLTDEEY
jgi:hypothetical protein